jgi:hypothetical protein
MYGLQTNHCRIVREALEGKRTFDEKALASLTALEEKLKKLKQLNKLFNDVDFSAAAKKALFQKDTLLVTRDL